MSNKIIYKDKNVIIMKDFLKCVISAEHQTEVDCGMIYHSVFIRYQKSRLWFKKRVSSWYISCKTKRKARKIFNILKGGGK